MLTGELTPEMQEIEEDSEDFLHQNRDTLAELSNTIYLSGPIRAVEDNGHGWRNDIESDYERDFNFLNPLNRYDPEEEVILNSVNHFDPESDEKQILPEEYIYEDKVDIIKSEYMFVGLADAISRGTSMECMYAHFVGTPYFVWEMDGQEESGWIQHHAEFVSKDRDKVIQEIMDYE